jgi:hypothetical protein
VIGYGYYLVVTTTANNDDDDDNDDDNYDKRASCRWEDNIKMDLQDLGCRVLTGFSCLNTYTGSGH